ncbi:hypothetical protein KXS11_03455 [Plantibacter flavus]|uniref:hypothetical protein n=1 Tax=Plantibacter flavus TaxID=150123 RepID=UPI003F1817BD
MTVSAHTLTCSIDGNPLDVKQARVTLDEGWSPYAQVQLTCSIPSPAVLEALDPRKDLRATLHLQQDFGDSDSLATLSALWGEGTLQDVSALYPDDALEDVTRTHYRPFNDFGVRLPSIIDLDLTFRERDADHDAGEFRVSVASDEALLEGHKLVSRYQEAPATPTVKAAVALALAHIGVGLDEDSTDAPVSVDNADSLIWNPGVSGWDYVYPLVQKAGLRLYCDEARRWKLVRATRNTEDLMVLTADHNVTSGRDKISLDDDWYDAVVITYKWRDPATATTMIAYDIAGDYRAKNVFAETRDVPFPGPGAADALLGRKQGRGRVLDVSAVSDYSAAPGRALAITLPGTPVQTGYTSSVTWSFPDDEMRIASRALIDTPESAWMFLPVGEKWTDSPTGASWLNEEVGT